MSLTSKSPRMVILTALAVGREALPDYAHRFSPKVFTQAQLFACLVYMTFLGTDYRGVEQHLADFPGLREWLGLKKVPDHSTLHKAAQRLFGSAVSQRLLAASVKLLMGRRKVVRRAVADSTGMESHHCSQYFVKRKAKGQGDAQKPAIQATSYTRFPKLSLLVDSSNHCILAFLTGSGPRPDVDELAPLLERVPEGVTIRDAVLDAGYDSESNHQLLRQEHGIRGYIPAKIGRPSKRGKPPRGRWRRLMRRLLRTKRQRRKIGFTQRWQVETVNSMIKRNLSEELTARSYHARNREMSLRALTHNIMVLLFPWRFSTEHRNRCFAPGSRGCFFIRALTHH